MFHSWSPDRGSNWDSLGGGGMILIDRRKGSGELLPMIRQLGVKAELDTLEASDACFEGNGPDGRSLVGIERKKISDLLHCIDDGRYAGLQQPGMGQLFTYRILIVEGIWKPSPNGQLMELRNNIWIHPTGHPVLYDKVFSFLSSVALVAGTTCIRSSTDKETAYQIVALYKWFNKAWEDHTSQFEHNRVVFPAILKPTFERTVAACLPGIGVKLAIQAEKHFKTMARMANADELGWMHIVGPKTASRIVKQIWGVK